MVAITSIVSVLPSKQVHWTEAAEREQLSAGDREVLARLGIETVREAEDENSTQLAAEAARILLALRGEAPEPGALLLLAGRHPELLVASEATRAQRAAGLRDGYAIGVADLGCASVSAGLLQARGLLAADPDLTGVLIAHGSRPPGPGRYRAPVTLNGDGAMALHIAAEGPLEILDVNLRTDGEFWDLFQVDYIGRPLDQWREACAGPKRYAFNLAVETRRRLEELNRRLLERAGLGIEDVDHVVVQNLSEGAFRFYEQTFEIGVAQACRTNLRAYGHVGATDIGLNLREGLDSGEFTAGDLVLVMNSSPVAAWSSMLLRVHGELPGQTIGRTGD